MAYNPFPTSYQPMYYPQYQTQPAQQQNNGLIWVQGEAGAKSYLLAPNTTIALWDSEKPVCYIKSLDASGMPSMKIIDYTVRGQEASTSPLDGTESYATKTEVNALAEQITALKGEIKALTARGE